MFIQIEGVEASIAQNEARLDDVQRSLRSKDVDVHKRYIKPFIFCMFHRSFSFKCNLPRTEKSDIWLEMLRITVIKGMMLLPAYVASSLLVFHVSVIE